MGIFNWLGSKDKRKSIPSSTQLESRFAEMPRVTSLIMRADGIADQTKDWYRNTFGRAPAIRAAESEKERIKSAVLIVAYEITIQALEANRREIPIPGETIPREFVVVIAFNFIVLRNILSAISGEIDLQEEIGSLLVLSADLLLHMRSVEEIKKWHQAALGLCIKIEQNQLANVKQFLVGLSATTEVYVIQLNSDKPQIREIDVPPMFSEQLGTILSSIAA